MRGHLTIEGPLQNIIPISLLSSYTKQVGGGPRAISGNQKLHIVQYGS